MAIQKYSNTRTAACDTIVGLLDQGSTYPNGHLGIYNADGTKITWHNLSNPAFGDATDGTSYAHSISDATALIDGTANTFRFEDCDGSNIWKGNVTLFGGGGSLQLEEVSIPKDTTIGLQSATYIVPA